MTAPIKTGVIPVLTMLAGLVAGVYLFLNYPGLTRQDRSPAPDISQVPDVILHDIHQTTYEQGSLQWTLEAVSARMIREENSTLLSDLVMTVFGADGKASEITAAKGSFSMKTGDAQIFGNVIIDDGTYRIRTESLNYRAESGILSTDRAVTIESDSASLTGDALIYDPKSMRTVIQGNVEGEL